MVVEEPCSERSLDEAEVLDRPPGLQRKVLARRTVWSCLVVIAENHEIHSARADVTDIQNKVPREFLLHRKVPRLYIARWVVRRDVIRANGGEIDIGQREEVIRIPLLCGAEARQWRIV